MGAVSTHGDCGCRLGRVESWVVTTRDPDSPQSSWRGGLCERPDPSLYTAASLSRRNFSKRKSEKREHRHSIWHRQLLGNSLAAAALDSSPPSRVLLPWWLGRPYAHTQGPGETAQPNLGDWRLLGNWAGGWPSANWEGRRGNQPTLSLLQPGRLAKLAWPV